MNERVLRLAMHAFRGVPDQMTVDFGKGESIAVYGDNGTGKSTIADALEWYFTGQIELLSHEGRQHAVRYVGGETDGGTSVEVVTNGTLSGTVVLPDERNLEAFDAIRRETFLLRGRTLADFINKTKTEKWKALVEILGLDAIESLREDLQRARNELRKVFKTAEEQVRTYERALSSGSEKVTHDSILSNLQQICGMLGVDPPQSLDQVDNPAWLTAAIGASAAVSGTSDREGVLAEVKTLSTPAIDRRAVEEWNHLASSERARLLPRAALVREAKLLFESGSFDKGHCPLCGQTVDDKSLARRIETALVEVMEASRAFEHVRDRVAQLADDLQAAHDKRLSIRNRARAMALDLSFPPRHPVRRAQAQHRCTRARRDRHDHELAVGTPQMGPRDGRSGPKDLEPGTELARHAARHAGGLVSASERMARGGEGTSLEPTEQWSSSSASSARMRKNRRKMSPSF